MTLPPYIEYPGNISYKQPFNLNNTEIYGFVVTGQTAAMQAMVDARLNFMNNRPDTKYFIATDKAIMTYTNSPCGQSTTNDGDKGMFTEITFICYTVVAECKKGQMGSGMPIAYLFLFLI